MKSLHWSIVLLAVTSQLSLIGAQLSIEAVESVVEQGATLFPVTTLGCRITGAQNTPEVRWRHENETFTEANTGKYEVTFNPGNITVLTIKDLVYTDSGVYMCEAMDNTTSSWVSDTVELRLLIRVNVSESSVTVNSDVSSVQLSCEMAGYIPPSSDLQWFRNGSMLQNNSDYTILYRNGNGNALSPGAIGAGPSVLSVLVIADPQVQDTGEYQCVIVSLNISETVQLTVMTPPQSTPAPAPSPSPPATPAVSSTPMTTGTASPNTVELTVIIAIVAALLGLIVIILVIIIIIVACQRCRQHSADFKPVSGGTSATVTTLPHETDPEYEEAPPVPQRTYSQGSRYSNKAAGEFEMKGSDMPDLIRYSGSHSRGHPALDVEASLTDPYYDNPEETLPPRIIPPASRGNSTKSKRTYYDEVELLDKGQLPGASGFSLSTVPSPHDVLSGSLQRQNPADVPEFNNPVPSYQDGFSQDDLAPFDTVEHDYDQIYSEPIEPGMLNAASTDDINSDGLPFSAIYSDPRSLGTFEAPLEITQDNIIEIKKLGNGQFGQVILARTRGLSLVDLKLSETNSNRSHSILVAVKKLKSDAETGLYEAFNKEVKFMCRLNHDNVIRLLGVCYTGERFIMMEYMENGDLNQFLQKHSLVDDTVTGLGDSEITPIILLYIGVQIASGMHYLASHRFVHRDLATRNCLVGKDFIVKISDFGMSRRLYESAYYRVQGTLVLPIRWMACETFYGKFSLKSDAWAFGVTLWELFTLASCDPYEEMNDEEVIQDAIRGPNRRLLPKPDACSRDVYDVMLRCWVHTPSMRADFGEIYSRLYMIYTSQAL